MYRFKAMMRCACAAALLLGASLARAAEPPQLLGRWITEHEPRMVLELNAGGKGTVDGMPLMWSVDGTNLTLIDPGGTDTTHWTVTGNRLVLTVGFGTELVFVRAQSSESPK